MTEPALFPRPGCSCTGTPPCWVCRGHDEKLAGWHCSRPDGHTGPCVLRADDAAHKFTSPTVSEANLPTGTEGPSNLATAPEAPSSAGEAT